MSNENILINFFDTDICVDLIAEEMHAIDDIKNRLPDKKGDTNVKLVDKGFFKRVLSDITNISLVNDELKVYFHRGVPLHIDAIDNDHNEYEGKMRDSQYRTYRVIKELMDLGEIKLRTSPFMISLTKHDLKASYFESLDDKRSEYPVSKNIHDDGLNCWGGWGGPVRSNFDSLDIEQSLIIMIQRMKQLNVDDYAGDIYKLSGLISSCYQGLLLEINPTVLLDLLIKYNLFDRNIVNAEYQEYRPFSRGQDGTLELMMEVKTNINYDLFIEVLEKMTGISYSANNADNNIGEPGLSINIDDLVVGADWGATDGTVTTTVAEPTRGTINGATTGTWRVVNTVVNTDDDGGLE